MHKIFIAKCHNTVPARKMGGKMFFLSARVPHYVRRRMDALRRLSHWSEAELLTEAVMALSDYVGRAGELKSPFKIVADEEAAKSRRENEAKLLAVLKEPDTERQALMLTGMIPYPEDNVNPASLGLVAEEKVSKKKSEENQRRPKSGSSLSRSQPPDSGKNATGT